MKKVEIIMRGMKSIIEASSAGVKDMADGSLRITFEFEPKDAADAFALFGSRGRAVGIAALVDGRAQIKSEEESEPITPEEPEKLKGGKLSQLAGQWCGDPNFMEYAAINSNNLSADAFIKSICGVEFKRLLDHDEVAAKKFHKLRHDYSDWLKT